MKHKLLQMRNSFIIAALTLVSLVSPTGTGASSPQTVPATTGPAQAVDPLPLYSITWTATGTGFSDVTDADGRRTVKNRKISMAGSGIWRAYAAGGWDYSPYELTVNDDSDQVITSPCIGQGGSDRDHQTFNITDPNRYSGGPRHDFPIIEAPLQRPDGSWYMFDPFPGFYTNRDFNYQYNNDYVRCGGDSGNGTFTFETGNYIVLDYPVYPGTIEGDAQGKVFTKTTQFVSPYSDPPVTAQWNVTVRVLETRDLTVDALEVTQGTQNETNTLPLIQGRRTVVRAYLGVGRDQVPVPNVTGKLSGYVGSTLLGSVPAFNPGGKITAPVDPNWKPT